MKKTSIIIALLLLFGLTSLTEAQIVVTSTTASTTHVKKERPKSGREKGWLIRPELGVGYHVMENGGFMLDPSVTIAYQFNPYFSIGAGTGATLVKKHSKPMYDTCYDNGGMASIPVYGNLRVYFCDRTWSPFFDLRLGVNFPVKKYYEDEQETIIHSYHNITTVSTQGITFQGTLGVQYKNFDVGFTLGMFNYYSSNEHFEDDHINSSYQNDHGDLKLLISISYNFQL